MANPLECRSCGYICHAEDAKCPYCGTPTSNPAQEKKTYTINKNDVPLYTSASRGPSNNNSNINICWLIFWLIVFWPIAIIYVIMKLFNKN